MVKVLILALRNKFTANFETNISSLKDRLISRN